MSYDSINSFYKENPILLNDRIYSIGNKVYRNFFMFHKTMSYFLDSKISKDNCLIHSELKDIQGFKRSGWSQRLRFITEFHLSELDWKTTYSTSIGDVKLNPKGIEIKDLCNQFYLKKNISYLDLQSQGTRISNLLNDDVSNFIKEHIYQLLINIDSDSMTMLLNAYLCSFRMINNEGYTIRYNRENIKATNYEIEIINKYFNVSSGVSLDYKWIGWITKHLENLELVELADQNDRIQKYTFSKIGKDVFNKIKILNISDEPIIITINHKHESSSSVKQITDTERIMKNASITGDKAEKLFEEEAHRLGWDIENKTDETGHGFDFLRKNSSEKYYEIKGCKNKIQQIRMTEKEWEVAKDKGDEYILVIVHNFENGKAEFEYFPNPYSLFNPEEKIVPLKSYYIKRFDLINKV